MSPAAAVGAGSLLQAVGQFEANKANAASSQADANFFKEQAEFSVISGKRTEDLFKKESALLLGAQEGAFVKAGVDMSGSPLLTLAHSREDIREEVDAIRTDTARRVKLSLMSANNSQANADKFGSFGYNFLTVGGSILSGAGQTAAAAG